MFPAAQIDAFVAKTFLKTAWIVRPRPLSLQLQHHRQAKGNASVCSASWTAELILHTPLVLVCRAVLARVTLTTSSVQLTRNVSMTAGMAVPSLL